MLAACNAAPEAQPASTRPVTTSTPLPPTVTPAAATASPRPTALATPTATPNQVLTPTLVDDISKIVLVSHGVLSNWNYLITFAFPEPVQGEYSLLVDANKTYTCITRLDHPDYLYCAGPMTRLDDFVDFELFAVGHEASVFQGEIFIPYELAN